MRILVVDDEPRELKSLVVMLKRFGYDVLDRPSGVDALKI